VVGVRMGVGEDSPPPTPPHSHAVWVLILAAMMVTVSVFIPTWSCC